MNKTSHGKWDVSKLYRSSLKIMPIFHLMPYLAIEDYCQYAMRGTKFDVYINIAMGKSIIVLL